MATEQVISPTTGIPVGRDNANPMPTDLWIRPDFDGYCVWDADGSLVDLSDCWPDLPGIRDLEERLMAWADAYDRHRRGNGVPVMEIFDGTDTEAALLRGRALAVELARLLGPRGVRIRFFDETIP